MSSLSFSVIYEGRRCVVKAAPGASTRLLSLIEEAARQFALDPARCQFKHKQRLLDASLPVRLVGLPQNATLDLIVSSPSVAELQKSLPVRVSLSVNATLSLSHSFPAETTLQAMLRHFADEGALPSAFDTQGDTESEALELVYMRSKFATREERERETLLSLGLAGQSVRFLLRYSLSPSPSPSPALPVNDAVAVALSVSVAVDGDPAEERAMDVATEEDAVQTNTVCAQQRESTFLSVAVDETRSETLSPSLSREGEGERERKRERDAEDDTAMDTTHNDALPQHTHATEISHSLSSSLSPREAISVFLSSNFDAVSKLAVLLMHRYVANILSNPAFSKYRSVNTKNKVFLEKLAEPQTKGALAFFHSVGFVLNKHADMLVLSDDCDKQTERERLENGLSALEWAFDELSLSPDERPQRPQLNAMSEGTNANPVEFDPFKTFMVRTAQQPPREASATEKQLETLRRRRLELEGDPASVQRETEVVLPAPPSSSYSSSKLEDLPETTSTSLSPALLQKVLNGSAERETPLTTQAVRDLHKAQTERVFQKTLVRVRFADRSQLCGYFHVRETIADVYLWVYGALRCNEQVSCVEEREGEVEEEERRRQRVLCACEQFDLSFSPPRTVLRPFPSLSRSLSRRTAEDFLSPSLVDAQLVPAALLTFTWRQQPPPQARDGEVGACLCASLLQYAISQSQKSIPASVSLVDKRERVAESVSQKNSLAHTASEKTQPAQKKEGAKLKWFKL